MICEQQSLMRISALERQIAQMLNLQIDEQLLKADLFSIETVLIQIYEFLNKNLDYTKRQPQDGYQSIEIVLQHQQQRNRNLIKKQLEYRQYQNSLIQQLAAQRSSKKELKSKITKLNDELRDKCLQILSLKNQNKSLVKDSKISCSGNLKTRQTMKQANKTIRQQTLYALYSSHKKKLDIVNNKSNQNFTVYKLDKIEDKINKTVKSHRRRSSEQVPKKPSESKKKSLEKKL